MITERTINQNELTSKYYRRMLLIILLTSVILSAVIVFIAGWFLAGKVLLFIFLGTLVILLIFGYAVLFIARVGVIRPMLNEMRLQKYSYSIDTLTGLCRREILAERTPLYEKDCESIGVLYVDINNLKFINDQFGHYAGDELITKVAEEIQNLRNDYTEVDYFRVGGDEFIIVVMNATEYQCRQLVTILAGKFVNIVLKRAKGQKANAAIGFAFSNSNIKISELMAEADADMYRNKRLMKEENTE